MDKAFLLRGYSVVTYFKMATGLCLAKLLIKIYLTYRIASFCKVNICCINVCIEIHIVTIYMPLR